MKIYVLNVIIYKKNFERKNLDRSTCFYISKHRILHTRFAMINHGCTGEYDKRRENESRFSQHPGESVVSFAC